MRCAGEVILLYSRASTPHALAKLRPTRHELRAQQRNHVGSFPSVSPFYFVMCTRTPTLIPAHTRLSPLTHAYPRSHTLIPAHTRLSPLTHTKNTIHFQEAVNNFHFFPPLQPLVSERYDQIVIKLPNASIRRALLLYLQDAVSATHPLRYPEYRMLSEFSVRFFLVEIVSLFKIAKLLDGVLITFRIGC
jgi:hypothetical protein